MKTIELLFGVGDNLDILQMSLRAIVVFIIALGLLRIAGRRSAGMRTPLDNVILFLLGSILSRAVTGASPFFPTIASTLMIVLIYRGFAWLGLYYKTIGRIVKGDIMLLYKDGKLMEENMKSCLISERDLMEGIRMNSNLNSFENIQEVYIERNGRISVIKKINS